VSSYQSDADRARLLIREIDSEKRLADACDSLQVGYRLGQPLAVKKGFFGRKRSSEDEVRFLTDAESAALYRMAGHVKIQALEKVQFLESQLHVGSA
jgi:hypothetical protein